MVESVQENSDQIARKAFRSAVGAVTAEEMSNELTSVMSGNKVTTLNDYLDSHTNGDLEHGVESCGKRLLLLSGNSEPEIGEKTKKYHKYLETHPQHLESMLYTLAWRRERLKLCSYCIVDGQDIGEAATPVSSKSINQIAFVFTGHGTEWVGMGREMIKGNEHFAASIQHMDDVLRAIEHPPAWNLKDLLLSNKADKDLFLSTDISQPAATAIQIAYVDTLAAWGLTPAAIIGHSSGEFAAAYAAGALNSQEAIIASYYRGYACAQNKLSGGMVAVRMSREEIEPYLQPGVVLACDNSNASVTISGDLIGLEKIIEQIKQQRQILVRQLPVPMAYHSSHMSTVAELYRSLIAHHLSPKAPNVPWYSAVYGRQVRGAKIAGPQYFIHNMERPALFRTAALQLIEDLGENIVHLEIGPHSALSGPLRQIYQESGLTPPYVAVAERGKDAVSFLRHQGIYRVVHILISYLNGFQEDTFLHSIGKLWSLGLKPAIPKSTSAFTLLDLPTYP